MAMEKVYKDSCFRCERRRLFPKYSCRTCSFAYTSNFKLEKRFDYDYQRKVQKRESLQKSDERLRTLYNRIRQKYFEPGYVVDGSEIQFTWKRGKWSSGAWCHKQRKEIRFGGYTKFVFIEGTDSNLNGGKKRTVCTMIHEMCHLRMAHHRKSFKQKVEEIVAKVHDEHINELFEGLVQKPAADFRDETKRIL